MANQHLQKTRGKKETVKGNNHLHQFTKILIEIIKENTHPKHTNKNSQKIISQLWKEAIMSLYMDNSYDNEMIRDLFNNLLEIVEIAQRTPSPHYTSNSPDNHNNFLKMVHISTDNSGATDKTNPIPNEPDHPAVNVKDAQKAPSLQHSCDTPDNHKSRMMGDMSELPTPLKSSNLD